jgi:hypothetical protein
MSQQINLNVSPYFDDFNANNDYHKVLFKPGVPVQARELTTLQSILQNQIEKFGQHFFKEGAKVIPGNTSYTQLYYCVQLQNTFLGVPVSVYADQLVGSKITGQTSGVTAIVDKILLPQDSERGNLTLYINYLSSSVQNNSTQQFFDGESLVSNITITSGLLGNTSIVAGQPFAVTISNNSNAIGSSFSISEGIYFVRGQFVNVNSETLILDQYNNTPSYRVGLFVNEEVINSDIDESLADNSQGFNNYAAPGADRLKISVSLFKKSLDDFDDNNFVELATINLGVLRSQVTTTEYSLIADELARRTYAESGDYIVKPFDVSIKESLNNNLGNRGIFNSNQFTYGGESPSENLVIYQVSSGKAVIRGYDVETISTTFLDVQKPRTVKTLENQSINYNTGSTLSLNNVYGTPVIGIGNTYILSLRDQRVGTSKITAPGKEIGVARVYDFRLESGSYNFTNENINEWGISLYDVQTFTEITLNEPITLLVPTFVEGANSGAHGFIRSAVSAGTALTIYDTQGTFLTNESFIFDGIESGRVAVAVTSHSISDVKSVYSLVGSASTFSADSVQSIKSNIGIARISPVDSGISTITSTNILFPGNLVKRDNLISYSDTSLADIVFAKVVSVGSTAITITGVTTVTGIAQGKLPITTLDVTDLKVLTTNLESSVDNTLYTKFPKSNISNVSLNNANLTIRKSFTVNIVSNQLSTTLSAGTNETFLPFDEERYSLIRSDGSTELLTSDKFSFTNGGAQLQIFNLGTDNTGATLITTLRKIKPKAKVKRKNRVNSIIIDKSKSVGSGIGGTTLNDGLEFGNYAYGTRVQDKNISLNVPDIIEIHGIFESADTSIPSAPKMVLSSINGPTNTTSDLIIGEQIVNQNGNTIGIVAEKLTSSQIVFVYKNQNNFKEGESVTFRESNIQAVITTLNSPSFDISFNYTFSIGQKGTFYDYGFVTRKLNSEAPSKKIKIYFSSGFYDSSDDGDITTVESYNTYDYTNEIKSINGVRNSDIIDIRPRVSPYTVIENSRSPFEFFGRLFNASGNSAANILASDEEILSNFSFYLGRIDRVYLAKDGKFQVKYGTPAENPEKPSSSDDSLELFSIQLPPYLYSVSDASIQFLEHKGYKMSDIRNLENRIKNLEYYTALSLLETNTANLFISDSNGLNSFKSGFFVDNFTSTLSQENAIEMKNSIDPENKELRPKHYTNSVDLIFGPVENTNPTDDLAFSLIEGINVRKTGDIVTLDYVELEWLKQSFATRTESVTPFLINFWKGTLEIIPASDTWVDTVRLEPKVITQEGNYAQTVSTLNVDPQTGFAPTVWNSWGVVWTGQETIESTRNRTQTTTSTSGNTTTTTTSVIQDNLQEVITTTDLSRSGTTILVSEQYDQTSYGDRVVSREVVPFMRSRNLQCTLKQVKPLTQLYAFFDGVDVTKYFVPKLLEINMISGVFEVGETVIGRIQATGLGPNVIDESIPRITFRVSQSNHKEGPYNSPSKVFPENPYINQVLPATYSSTSSILNIDTFSLSNEPQGLFNGWVESGMVLIGSISGAQASITNIRLVSDLSATLIGSLFIPNPNSNIHPRFETGTKPLTFINNTFNDQNSATTIAEENFYSSGTLETVQEDIISVRNASIDSRVQTQAKEISKSTGTQVVSSNVLSSSSSSVTKLPPPPPAPAPLPTAPKSTIRVKFRVIGDGVAGFTHNFKIPSLNIDVFKPTRTPLNEDVVRSIPNRVGVYEVQFFVNGSPGGSLTLKNSGKLIEMDDGGGNNPVDMSVNIIEVDVLTPVFFTNIRGNKCDLLVGIDPSEYERLGYQIPSSETPFTTTSSGGRCYVDPLAQSFKIDESTGIFLTRCDVFFETKDDTDIPVTVQIRTIQNGFPSEFVLPFSEIVLDPDEVQISNDSSIATPIVFKSPIYLEGGKEYCICLLSNSTKYRVFISRVGENDLLTQTFISNQPYLGSLFKSQNASTWEPSQWEDLKFTLYRADFVGSGTVEVYSPELSGGNNQIAKLMPNSLNFNSKKVRISLASTINDSNFIIGNTVLQSGTNASGNYVGNAGIATGSLNIINAGIGYTPSSGIATFSGINLQTITGKGRDATANVTINNGVAIGASITSGGSGYQIGDVLGISSIGASNVGTNARFSLSNISNLNQIIVDNIQGDFVVGAAKTIQYIGVGIGTTNLNGSGVLVSEIIEESDGRHVKIDHKNHGMYFDDNLVTISNVESDIKPTKLSIQLAADSTGSISVDDSSAFGTFENVGVGTTNPGYLLIGDEVIEYTSTSIGVIGGNIVRGTNPTTHPIGSPVYKYELNGVSLRRINKTHDLNDVTVADPITFDSYHIKLDMSSAGIGRSVGIGFPTLYANQTKSTGGYNTRATQNMPFEIITPLVQNLTVQGTSLSAEVRTITGSSISGNEIPFTNVGFEPITINAPNYLDSTRIIASKVNEDNKLSNLSGNKSMNMRLTLGTTDTRISPVLDTQRISTILTSNRVNSVIQNYATDARVDTINGDPSAFQYISKEITLENPASSIKIILDAHINLYSDIRAFYAISENQNFDPIFTPFPGYNNLDQRGQIIDFESSDGLSDKFISKSSTIGFTSPELEYREYVFTSDQLSPFRSYRIKLIMTSTNQVYVPRVRNLRVITLA